LEDRRNVGECSCNSGDGTDQRVQSLMFTMMMIFIMKAICGGLLKLTIANPRNVLADLVSYSAIRYTTKLVV